MRCRTLARELRRRGAAITFLCRRQPGDLIELLAQEFRVLELPECPQTSSSGDVDSHPLSGRALYRAWLGCPEEQDAVESLVALAEARLQEPAWLVVDHYGLGAPWQRRMQNGLRHAPGSSPEILVLDDLADRPHQANLLMDANRLNPAAPDPYWDLVPEACSTLLGPAYA